MMAKPYKGTIPSGLPANVIVLSGGIMGIDAQATDYPAVFYSCCKSNGCPGGCPDRRGIWVTAPSS